MRLSLDIDGILERFAGGSLTELSRLLTDKGLPITKQGVLRWKTQGILPMQAWLKLCEIERARDGRVPDLRKFIIWGRK